MIVPVLLSLALISGPVGTSSAAGGDTFATPLERELWDTVVLLEGDLATATIALAACETKRGRCAATVGELARLPELTPAPESPAWWWVVLVGAAVAGAAAGGYLAGRGL